MNVSKRCSKCRVDLGENALEGLCPKCLLADGLALLAQHDASVPREDWTRSTTPLAPGTGTTLSYFGDYELINEIARGGMGVVYRARQRSLNRLVALKLISAGALATVELVKRFQAEAEAAASLSHPNIVPIYEIGEHQGQHYFSMGLIEGPNLRDALAERRKPRPEGENGERSQSNDDRTHRGKREYIGIDPREASQLLIKVAHAVHYAHQRGVLHRDLKPSNILLDEAGEPHLTDFGLAKLTEKESTLTHTNAILGTPAYMAPEQARGDAREVTTAADVYGLGAMLYEALTGSPPFGGGTSLETIRQVLDQEPRPPSLWNSKVDRDLETICLKCLEKEPSRRYSSAASLAAELERWGRGEPILARRGSAGERLRKWARRRPAVAALSVLSILLVLGLAIGSTVAAWRIDAAKGVAVRTAAQLRVSLYASDMSVAYQSWQSGGAARTRVLLTNQIPAPGETDLRGWEWRYLWLVTRPLELDEFETKGDSVLGMEISPDGRHMITCGGSATSKGQGRWWDAATHRPVTQLGPDFGWGYCIRFSPDGKLFLTAHAEEQKVRIWDAATQQPLGVFTNHTLEVCSAAFVPGGTTVVSTGGFPYSTNLLGELKLWDARDFSEIGTFDHVDFPLVQCDASSDGRLVAASGVGPIVQVWDSHTRQRVRQFSGHSTRDTGMVLGLRFSPDGKLLATGDYGGVVRLWDLQTGNATVIGFHREPVLTVNFSPDGTRLASAGYDHTVKLWDVVQRCEVATLRGHANRVWSVAFARDGRTITSGDGLGIVKVWDANPPPENAVFTRSAYQGGVGYSSDGRFLAWRDTDTISVWDTSKKIVVQRLEGDNFVFSLKNEFVAVESRKGELQIWRLQPLIERLNVREIRADRYAFSADGSRFAAGNGEGEIVVWTLPSWQERASLSVTAQSRDHSFAPDGESLLSLERTQVTQWRIADGRPLGTVLTFPEVINAYCTSPDDRLLALGGRDGTVQLNDLTTRRVRATLVTGAGEVKSLAFSSDSKTLAVGSFEGGIHLWNVASGRQVGLLSGHLSFVHSLAFSPDGTALASGSFDHTLRVWKSLAPQESSGSARSAR